ncbi:MAG TPA: ABC transporter permease [Cytophagaceae bacterium]
MKGIFDIDKWQEIYNTVRKNKLRTFLTAFGVAWGIFMLVLLLGAGKGLENGVLGMFGNMAKNSMWVWGGKTGVPYQGLKPGRWISFTNEDYEAIKREIPEVKYLAPSTRLGGEFIVSYKNKNGSYQVSGEYPDIANIKAMNYPSGRFINDIDIREKRKVAVLGERPVQILFGGEDPVGKYIKIKGVYFLVIGAFTVENTGGDGRGDAEKIFIPLSTLQQTFNEPNRIHVFGITPKEDVPAELVEQKVKSLLATRHKVAPSDEKAIGAWNSGKEILKFQALFFGIKVFVWGVGVLTIIAGIVGVSNIMLIIVKERTKEIGIRKALGATPGSIVSLIILESVVITSFSGYIGLVTGVAVLEAVRSFMESAGAKNEFFSNPEIDISIALYATAILVIAGAFAGLIPAGKAARINPIEALRSE